jgi:hypothetical protein
MTKNSAQKKAARAYQDAHPNTRLADALRAVERPVPLSLFEWRRGEVPWLRRFDVSAVCYFCGNDTAILSFGDMPADCGRLQAYCQHPKCDAREVEVIVIDDTSVATRNRTDVRILAHFPPAARSPYWETNSRGRDWTGGTPPFVRAHGDVNRAAPQCLFCGERSIVLSRNDVTEDGERIRLHCKNSRCAVVEIEAVLMRGGARLSSSRPDVRALHALFPTRADQLAADLHPGDPAIFPVADFSEPADGVDPLAMRIRGPVPWED